MKNWKKKRCLMKHTQHWNTKMCSKAGKLLKNRSKLAKNRSIWRKLIFQSLVFLDTLLIKIDFWEIDLNHSEWAWICPLTIANTLLILFGLSKLRMSKLVLKYCDLFICSFITFHVSFYKSRIIELFAKKLNKVFREDRFVCF